MFGGLGEDEMRGGPGDDKMYGGPGMDTLYGGEATTSPTVRPRATRLTAVPGGTT